MAERAGFSIVHPEKLPLIEQVRLFKGARELVGEYGSAMHGSIFSPPDTIVGALRGSARHPAFIQSGIGQSLGQPTGYVFGPTDDRDPAQGFTVSEEDFADCLRLIFDGVPLRSAKIDAAVERSGPAGRGIGVRGADAGRTLDAQGANMPHSGLSQSLDEIGLKFQTDKASHHHGYLGFYERFFADLRDRKDLRLLEIGVHQGASARMWEEYFPDGRIIGVDVNPDARQHASGRIVVELADQSDVAALVALGAHGPFDIIIDDGSHVWDHQITSFRYLYPLLKAGGYYVMEDIDTSFGAAAETYRGVGDRSAAEYLHHFCNYLVGDPALDISREPDAFIRSYARKTEFLAFHRRTCVMRRKAG
jgi:predicted O-methyltransferase YrrM